MGNPRHSGTPRDRTIVTVLALLLVVAAAAAIAYVVVDSGDNAKKDHMQDVLTSAGYDTTNLTVEISGFNGKAYGHLTVTDRAGTPCAIVFTTSAQGQPIVEKVGSHDLGTDERFIATAGQLRQRLDASGCQ